MLRIAAILAVATACTGRAVIPPGAPPEIALPPLARDGDPDAQVSLGYMYQNGQSFEQSYSQAARWYRPAAEQGNDLAQFALGELYARGLGLDQNYYTAAYWFRRAAMNGNLSAQFRLANFYERGLGVPQDYAIAAQWYGRASQASRGQGALPPAIERLIGRAYRTPVLIPPPRLFPAGPSTAPQALSPRPDADRRMALAEPEPRARDGVWVHIASFRGRRTAAYHWRTLKQRHAVLLGGLTAEFPATDLGGERGVWVRVVAGPLADIPTARSLCAALQAQGVYCLPVAR